MNTPAHGVTFECNGDTLVGILHQPVTSTGRGVLIVVGGPQYRVGSHRQFVLLARDLAADGFPVFRFDYRGMGDSEGEFRGFEHVEDDIAAAIEAFRSASPGLREIVLWGLCDGGTAAAFFAGHGAQAVKGLVVANPWVRTEQGLARAYVSSYYGRRLSEWTFWRKLLRGEMKLLRTARDFLADVRKARTSETDGQSHLALPERLRHALQSFPGPVLLLLSGNDLTAQEFVACAAATEWQPILARSVLRRQALPDADHTFSRRHWQDEASRVCADWLRSW